MKEPKYLKIPACCFAVDRYTVIITDCIRCISIWGPFLYVPPFPSLPLSSNIPQKKVWRKKGRETLAANASALLSKGFISDSADSKPQKLRISSPDPTKHVGHRGFPHVCFRYPVAWSRYKPTGILDWKWYEFPLITSFKKLIPDI